MDLEARTAWTRPGLLLAMVLVVAPMSLTTMGCTGPAKTGEDTGKKTKEPPPPPPKRSYDTPDVPITDEELEELDAFCRVTMECARSVCSEDDIKAKFKLVKVKTSWGKKLQKLFANEPIDRTGKRLGRLVDEEGLHHKSSACRQVRARFD